MQVVKEPGRNASSARPLGRGARVLPLGKAAGGCLLYETGLGAASHARLVSKSLLEHRFVVATAAIIEDAPWAEKTVKTTQPGLSGLLVQSFAQVRAGLSRGLKLVPIAPQAEALPARPLSFHRAVRPGRTRQSGSYMCLRSAKLGEHMKVAGIYRLEL